MLTANYKIQTFKFRAKKGIVDLRYLSVWHLMVHSPDISLNCLLQVLALGVSVYAWQSVTFSCQSFQGVYLSDNWVTEVIFEWYPSFYAANPQ